MGADCDIVRTYPRRIWEEEQLMIVRERVENGARFSGGESRDSDDTSRYSGSSKVN
jgi:hypothetical protein